MSTAAMTMIAAISVKMTGCIVISSRRCFYSSQVKRQLPKVRLPVIRDLFDDMSMKILQLFWRENKEENGNKKSVVTDY